MGRPRDCDIRLRHTRRAVHGQAQGDDSRCAIAALRPQRRRSGSPSRNFRPWARWVPGCRLVTNASMATTFNAFTRATITHCNGVRRINRVAADCPPMLMSTFTQSSSGHFERRLLFASHASSATEVKHSSLSRAQGVLTESAAANQLC
jgi:hypothetical protein